MKSRLAACLGICLLNGLLAANVPPDGVLTFTDHGYRDWGPEVVNYSLDTTLFPPEQLRLTGPDGQPVPCQVDGATLAFVASVPQGGTVQYRLAKAGGDAAASDLQVTAAAGQPITVANRFLRLYLPPDGVSEGGADATLFGWSPAVATQPAGGATLPAAALAGISRKIVRRGPAVFTHETRAVLAGGGEYVCRVELAAGMPLVRVTEEWSRPIADRTADWVVLDLNRGWQPDFLAWEQGAQEQQMPKLQVKPFGEYLETRRKAGQAAAPVGGVGEAPSPLLPDGAVRLGDHVPAGKWGGKWGAFQLWQGAQDQPAAGPGIAWIPLHAGSWRHAMAGHSWVADGNLVRLSLPLGNRPIRWSIDIADDFSPFSTHEHDVGLSPAYGRREWGLYLGAEPHIAQAQFGYMGLDRYKDWILDWPDTAGTAAYPGAFFNPSQIAQLKTVLDRHPDADYLRQWYLISGNPEHAVAHARAVIEELRKPYGENNFFIVGLSNYRKSQFYTFVNEAEDALACPELPADLRLELRLRLALYAYAMSDPDLNPRGSGVHLGNNNMTINRTLALTYFAGLLPDHPRCAYWMDRAKHFAQFKFATQTAPDGGWVACPSYQLYSPTRTLNVTQVVMRNRGLETFSKYGYEASTLRYLANLLVPDARFPGWRVIPGMGNSCNQRENVWGFAMAAFSPEDDATAGWLRWVYEQATGGCRFVKGPNAHDGRTPHPFWFLPQIESRPAPMTTAVIPSYGVIFRDGFGTDRETAMLFRTGINWSHWDTDSLNVLLYANGAPLSPGTGYQYVGHPMQQDSLIYHNRVKVGLRDAQVVFGRVDAALADYALGGLADYAMADHYYPPEIFSEFNEEMHWRRHLLFMKSSGDMPSYFVMRDAFAGPAAAPTWWNWMNLGTADLISVDGTPFDPAQAPIDKVVPVSEMPVKRGQTVLLKTAYGSATWIWFDRPVDVRLRMTATYSTHDGSGKETKSILEIPSTVADGYQYAVVPLRDGQPPPACESLPDGTLKLVWGDVTDTAAIVDGQGVKAARTAAAGALSFAHDKPSPVVQTIAPGLDVRGEGPFTATLDGEVIRLATDGRARILHVSKPEWMIRPQYFVDGQEWMASWTDYPASGWGTFRNTNLVAISVPAGQHRLELRNMVFPLGWDRPFGPLIDAAQTAPQ